MNNFFFILGLVFLFPLFSGTPCRYASVCQSRTLEVTISDLYEPGPLHGVAPAVVAGHGGVRQQEVRVERRAVGGQAVRASAGQRHLT